MAICDCVNPGEPRDIVEHKTRLYQAVGGRLYRLHIVSSASAIEMGDGMDVETRIRTMERMLQANTTIHFADSISGRNGIAGLAPGDLCYVFDAQADPTVPYGSAMYIWLPSLSWKKCFNGDSPIDALNMIRPGGGLAAGSDGKLYVDFSLVPASSLTTIINQLVHGGDGLAVGSDGKLKLDTSALYEAGGGLKTGASGKLAVDAAALFASGGGLAAGSDGKLKVDFSQMPAADQAALVLGMIQTGGGLAVNSQGKIFFDPEAMDTTVFEKLMKTLRLPIWLTQNTTYYVDQSHANAANTLDEGRGLTADKPFLTIQACVDYICENYNLGSYSIIIKIAAGQYDEVLTLGNFSRTTGSINLVPKDAGEVIINNDATPTQNQPDRYTVSTTGAGFYVLQDLTIRRRVLANVASTSYAFAMNIDSRVRIDGLKVVLDTAGATSATHTRCGCVTIGSNGNVDLCCTNRNIELVHNSKMNGDAIASDAVAATGFSVSGTMVAYDALNDATIVHVNMSGNMSTGMNVNGGMVTMANGSRHPVFSGTGQQYRFVLSSGGRIACYMGPDYFPGTTAGTIESATYSWYK